jgi:hypothetical protein
LKPRSRQTWSPLAGPAVGALAAMLLLATALPAVSQPPGGQGSAANRGATGTPATSAPPARGGGGFYSNLGLLESISREAANAIADSLTLPAGSTVTLLARTPHEANWFVGNLLAQVLAERGYKVRVSDWSPAPPAGGGAAAGAAAGAAGGAATGSPTPQQGAPSRPRKPKANQPSDPAGSASTKEPAGAGAGNASSDSTLVLHEKAGADSTEAGRTKAAADSTGANPDSVRARGRLAQGRGAGTPPAETPPAGVPAATQPGTPAPSAQSLAIEQAPPVAEGEFPAGNVLDLRVVEFGVGYSDIGRKLLFGPVHFTRVGGVYLQVSSLQGPEGDLRQVLSAERHRVDRLSGSQRSLAEGASYPFNVPELKTPGLGRYIEPTVVVGIVASLVYLFYANQSSK